MNKVLIVGGTGFVGRRLVTALVARGTHCRVTVHATRPNLKADPALVEFVQADTTHPESLTGLAEDVEVVYNLASVGHVSAQSQDAHHACHQVNVAGTENLARVCAGYPLKRFVHFSSTAAVGTIRSQSIDEEVEPRPYTPYQCSKRRGEVVLAQVRAETGLPAVVLRPCMIYGPGGQGEFLRFCRLISKGLFPRAGWGSNLTPAVYVDDVVSSAILAGKRGRPGETYFVASDQSPRMVDIHRAVTKALGRWRPYPYAPVWTLLAGAFLIETVARWQGRVPFVTRANIRSTVASRVFLIEKAQRELGYAPQVPLEDGVALTVEWYVSQGLL